MDSDGLPIVGPGIDYTRIPAIQQKRTVAFLNHFVRHTAHFLNRFGCVCEQKLEDACVKIQRLETALCILEAKLASIPGLENVTAADTPTQSSSADPPASASAGTTPAPAADVTPAQQMPVASQSEVPAEPEPEPDVIKVKDDPRYTRFFKMVQMGVPLPAVQLKMTSEGLDASLLETPDAPAPAGGAAVAAGADSDSSDDSSIGSFSDSD